MKMPPEKKIPLRLMKGLSGEKHAFEGTNRLQRVFFRCGKGANNIIAVKNTSSVISGVNLQEI